MTFSKAPSTTTTIALIPCSLAKDITLRHARASMSSIVGGSVILSERAPTALPVASHITTPILAFLESWKTAPSKFSLRVGLQGGVQGAGAGSGAGVGVGSWTDWNSWIRSSMSWYIIDRGRCVLFIRAAFRLYQILQATQVKHSTKLCSLYFNTPVHKSLKSTKCAASWFLKHCSSHQISFSSRQPHIVWIASFISC